MKPPKQPAATGDPPRDPPPFSGCTLRQYADAKRLPFDFLIRLGLRQQTYCRVQAVRISYLDEAGNEVAVRFRVELEKRIEMDADGQEIKHDDRFRWRAGDHPTLYGLCHLADARKAGEVNLVEGESDTHTLWFHRQPAIGLPGASQLSDKDAKHLDGIARINIVIEPDKGGETLLKRLAQLPLRDRVFLVTLPDGFKDVSAMHIADPDAFKARWQQARDAAVPWSEMARVEAEAHIRDLWKQCQYLAMQSDILKTLLADLQSGGFVGEETNAKIIYLACTSRVLDRIVSIAGKGPSAVGKSYTFDCVLDFIPKSCIMRLTAGSPKCLIYDEEPLEHKMIYVREASAFSASRTDDDNTFEYILRSLMSEGEIDYMTVEKTRDGLRTRHIHRPGPTGLLITTTRISLHAENETRVLTITADDSPDQTRRILIAQALRENGDCPVTDKTAWHALQEWIALQENRVSIPFAAALAKLTRPVAVRLRRDFPQILTLIKTHAVLHQATRERDAAGRIVATLEDYSTVRALVADLVAEGVSATVKGIVRSTVNAAKGLLTAGSAATVTRQQIATKLGLDKSAAWRRVEAAIKEGYLVNEETQRRKPARIALGDPMPDDIPLLPDVDTLRNACAVEAGCNDACNRPPHDNVPPPSSACATDANGCTVAEDSPGEDTSSRRVPASSVATTEEAHADEL